MTTLVFGHKSPDTDSTGSPILWAWYLKEVKGIDAEAVLLGCAGMTDLAASLSEEFGVPVIDGVAAALKLAEALAGLGVRTSKVGLYAVPAAKPYSGRFADFAPSGEAP